MRKSYSEKGTRRERSDVEGVCGGGGERVEGTGELNEEKEVRFCIVLTCMDMTHGRSLSYVHAAEWWSG